MTDILERGDLFFFYRPRVHSADDFELVRGPEDVGRAFMILRSHERGTFRLVVLGRKRLPAQREREWAQVERVGRREEDMSLELGLDVYETKTRGLRVQPPARTAGEGVYALVGHDGHTHLGYVLGVPERPGEVQDALEIRSEASYIVAVRNPEAPYPPGMRPRRRMRLPATLQARFGKRKFAPADPELLDHEGVELVLIGGAADAGVDLDPSREAATRAEMFRELRALAPLTQGRWE
jgi:hypothetical protein